MNPNVAPRSVETEQALLGGILLYPSAIHDAAAILTPIDFWSVPHQHIFQACLNLNRKGVRPDITTVVEELRVMNQLAAVGGPVYLCDLPDFIVSPSNIKTYAYKIKEHAQRRRVADIALQLFDSAGDLTKTPREMMADALRFSEELASEGPDTANQTPFQLVDRFMVNLIQRKEAGGVAGIPTRFDKINELIGGLVPGDVIVIAARPSKGKSALALNMATDAAFEGCSTGIISLEMPSDQLLGRLFSTVSGVNASKVRDAKLTGEELQVIQNHADPVSRLPLRIYDKGRITPMQLRAVAYAWKREMQNLDLLVIDYVQLINPDSKADSREREVADVSRSIKALAIDLHIPIIVLAQLNRNAEGEKYPKLSHLRESGAIEADADVVIFIGHWKAENGNPTVPMSVAKARSARCGKFDLLFLPHIQKFENYSPLGY